MSFTSRFKAAARSVKKSLTKVMKKMTCKRASKKSAEPIYIELLDSPAQVSPISEKSSYLVPSKEDQLISAMALRANRQLTRELAAINDLAIASSPSTLFDYIVKILPCAGKLDNICRPAMPADELASAVDQRMKRGLARELASINDLALVSSFHSITLASMISTKFHLMTNSANDYLVTKVPEVPKAIKHFESLSSGPLMLTFPVHRISSCA